MTKSRKKYKRKKEKSFFKKSVFLYFILGTFLIFLFFLVGYFSYNLGYSHGKREIVTAQKYVKPSNEKKRVIQKEKEALKHILQKRPLQLSEIEDYKQNTHIAPIHPKKSEEKSIPQQKKKRAKLAIIIDDVAFGYQVKAIKNLHMVINPSFFPPSPSHPNTPIYAKEFRHYMIHLPMEAMYYNHSEKDTLLTSSSPQFIENVISHIRKDFPKAKYINNHTGSKFTSNYQAMKRLIPILDKYGFQFIDSRTTPLTKVPLVQKEFHHLYIARNIFLDNKQNVKYIKNQLRQAVKLAQKKGFAIAIGHPHPATLKALRESQDILKKVKLVYIDEVD